MIGGALLVGTAVSAYGYEWATVGRYFQSTDDAYVGGDVTAIAPHVAGFVSDVEVSDNQYVRKGQLLVRLDNRDFAAAAAHAEAVVHEREAVLRDLEAKYGLQQTSINQAAAELASKQARAAFTSGDNARYQALQRAVATSQQDASRAFSANEQAQSDVVAARARRSQARSSSCPCCRRTWSRRAPTSPRPKPISRPPN